MWIPKDTQFGSFQVVATATNAFGSVTDTTWILSEAIRTAYNQVQVDVTQRGKIGTQGQYGKGITYKGQNGLYVADFSLVDRNDVKYAGGLYSSGNSFHPLEGFSDAKSKFAGFEVCLN